MLIDFRMSNYKSFDQETTLSAETGERLRKYKRSNTMQTAGTAILKNLLIFGPNGAGKSNLLDALKTMRQMIVQTAETVSTPLPYHPFILKAKAESPVTTFEISFSKNNHFYHYKFAYTQEKIFYERLDSVKNGKSLNYFERSDKGFFSKSANIKKIAKHTRDNSLVLYNAMQNNIDMAVEAYQWFADDLIFVNDYDSSDSISDLIGLVNEAPVKEQLLNFLHFADLNISDLEVVQIPSSSLRITVKDGVIKSDPIDENKLMAVHKVYDTDGNLVGKQRISMDGESRGTRKILMIALAFINAEKNNNGKTLLFDEFDDSLHLELSRAMVKIFNSEANRNQFILTTHELQLLDSPVRVDQIYLVSKDFKGKSDLTSLFDFKDTRSTTRDGISYMKRYMEGRFGATPSININEMLNALTNKNDSTNKN